MNLIKKYFVPCANGERHSWDPKHYDLLITRKEGFTREEIRQIGKQILKNQKLLDEIERELKILIQKKTGVGLTEEELYHNYHLKRLLESSKLES